MPVASGVYVGPDLTNLAIGGRPVVLVAVGEGSPVTGFPTATSVGIDAIDGWTPVTTIEDPAGYVLLNDEGAIYEDIRWVNTVVLANVPHVTLRRCEIVGGTLINYNTAIANDLLFEDSTIRYVPAGSGTEPGTSSLGIAGFTMLRSSMLDVNEGIRLGGSDLDLLEPADGYDVNIIDSYIRIIAPNPYPEGFDWHGDCLQAADTGVLGDGVKCTIRNSTFISDNSGAVGGNSCIISGPGHSLPFDIDGLIMSGGGYTFYNRVGGDYSNVYFVEDSWTFGPIDTDDPDYWDIVTTWDNIKVCTLGVDGQPDEITGTIPLGYNGGPFDPP